MLRVCHVVANINRDVGGPAVTVTKLASALGGTGNVVSTLVTLDYQSLGPQVLPDNTRLVSLPAGEITRRFRGWNPQMQLRLREEVKAGDIMHNHGLWMLPNVYARQAAVAGKIPLVISPRGMLSEWSLGRSRIKKVLAWTLFERHNLDSAALFHATSESEANDIRRIGLRQPIAIIPNGIEMPSALTPRTVLESRFPALKDKRWILFLSRLHPKKGVAELLGAWRTLNEKFPDWHLILAGPDLNGYGKQYRNAINGSILSNRVTFTGVLAGIEKNAALSNAELFVLPTHSENFGVVIGEALAHGVPVITTKAAPWPELESRHCGWWIDLDQRALQSTMEFALSSKAIELEAMGARGRIWMKEGFSWTQVGLQMYETYSWLGGGNGKPGWIYS